MGQGQTGQQPAGGAETWTWNRSLRLFFYSCVKHDALMVSSCISDEFLIPPVKRYNEEQRSRNMRWQIF